MKKIVKNYEEFLIEKSTSSPTYMSELKGELSKSTGMENISIQYHSHNNSIEISISEDDAKKYSSKLPSLVTTAKKITGCKNVIEEDDVKSTDNTDKTLYRCWTLENVK